MTPRCCLDLEAAGEAMGHTGETAGEVPSGWAKCKDPVPPRVYAPARCCVPPVTFRTLSPVVVGRVFLVLGFWPCPRPHPVSPSRHALS